MSLKQSGMYEKIQLPAEKAGQEPRPKPRLSRCGLLFVLSPWLYLMWAFFSLTWKLYTPSTRHHGDGTLRKYEGEHLSWHPCGPIDDHDVECSAINVPMDQFNKTNSGDKTFTIPLVRLRGKNATRSVLVNPGGPGGSGINFVYRGGKYLKAAVGEDLHIVGFDPRGVNSSRPAARCYPNQAARDKHSHVAVFNAPQYSPELYTWTENYVQSCADTAGEQAEYMNTPQTAADMNSIIDALGQEYMVYWGFSYGTLLGQTYAGLFPERSERVIIDGVVDPFIWYEELFTSRQYIDSDNAAAAFFHACIAEKSSCALSQLSDNETALQRKVMSFIESLKRAPINVYLNNTVYGTLDYDRVLQGFLKTLYQPQDWYIFADNMAQLMAGNATAAFLEYGVNEIFGGEAADHFSIVHNNDAISGRDNWPQREELAEAFQPFLNQSIFAPFWAGRYYEAAQWRMSTTHTFRLPRKVTTKNPLLILSQQYDPVTPLASARVSRDTFEGSRLVEIGGTGHCSPAIRSTCAIEHARRFLVHGILPERDVKCSIDGQYFISPKEKSEIGNRASGLASEADELWAAQLMMSQALNGV